MLLLQVGPGQRGVAASAFIQNIDWMTKVGLLEICLALVRLALLDAMNIRLRSIFKFRQADLSSTL